MVSPKYSNPAQLLKYQSPQPQHVSREKKELSTPGPLEQGSVYWLIDSEEASWKDSKLTTKSSSAIVRRLTDLSYVLEDITQRQKVNPTIDLTFCLQHYEPTMKMRAETWW